MHFASNFAGFVPQQGERQKREFPIAAKYTQQR
jgi:hypothetical protein